MSNETKQISHQIWFVSLLSRDYIFLRYDRMNILLRYFCAHCDHALLFCKSIKLRAPLPFWFFLDTCIGVVILKAKQFFSCVFFKLHNNKMWSWASQALESLFHCLSELITKRFFCIGFVWKMCWNMWKAHVYTFPMTSHPLQLLIFGRR